MHLTPAMVTALRSGRWPVAPLIRADLPGYTLTHLVGAGVAPWGADVYTGKDPRFGALISASNLRDGAGDEAPEWELTFAPPSEVAAALISAPEMQGSPVSGWIAVINPATGQVLADPLNLFTGTLDVPRLRVGRGTRTVEWRCLSALDSFHDINEGARLSDAWHKSVWPSETGLANMTGIDATSYWGVENPPSNIVIGSGGARNPSESGWVNAR
jgi:hypothetical protein